MKEEKRALRCFVISSNKSSSKDIINNLNRYRSGIDIVQSENLHHLKNIITAHDIIFLDDEFIYKVEKEELTDLILFLSASQFNATLFTNYKKKIPAIILDRPDLIQIVSISMKRDEFFFHMESIEYRFNNSLLGNKRLHDKYLETIIQIQNLLLANTSTEFKLTNILKWIGKVSGASRVTLFENRFDYQGRLLMSQGNEWSDAGIESQLNNPLFNLLPYHPNFSRWENILTSGTHICSEIGELPNSEKPLLKTLGIKKLLLIPILIKGEFWGFVMLSCTDRELWADNEISLLKSVIAPIASFLEIKIEKRKRDRSDERLRKIFENSNIGLVLATKEGNLKSFNPAFSEMLGYSEKELKNLNFRVFSHPDDLSKELLFLNDLLDGKIPSYLIEKRFLKKGGSTIWVKLNVSAYSKEKGKPESLIGIVENITNEKKAEKALQESEDRYRKLSDLSLEGIVLHQNGVAIDCNECFLDMYGYSREELIGKNFVELFADKNSIDLVLAKIQSNDLSPYEAIGRGKSGDSIPVELENRNVEYDGEMFRVTAFRDITERKKSEQEIRKLNIAIDQSPSSIVITDKEGKIEYVNKAFYEITGYSMDETLGSNPNVLKTDYHPNEYYKQLWNTISSGKTWHGIFRNKAKSGAYYWERAVISPIIDERKNITHYLAIKENITKEKKAQEALKISEEHHRIISELTNDFVYSAFIKNEKLSLGWKSGTLEKLSGYSITEIREMEYGWYSVVFKDDFEGIIIPAINKLRIEKVLNFEYRIKTKSGKLKWVSDKVKFIERKDVSGKMNVIGAIRDITLRKEANLALDQSKKYLDSIIDNLPVGLQIYDEYGYTARINESQRKLLGLKDLNVGKGSFNILNDPLSIAIGSDKRFREVYEKKKTVSYEVELNFEGKGNEWGTKKGKVEIHQIIFPIFKEDGNIHSVISLSNDITKRVSAEKALKASEMHQKALLRIIPDLIFTFTKDGVFKDVYTEDPGKLLLPTDQIIGKPYSEVFSRALSEKFYTYLNKAVETNEMQVYNYKLDVNGIVNYYETRLLVSKENEVIAIIRDDTDNIVAERALKESEEKFRELAERTQDALVLISTTNEILYVSPNLISILGISPESYTNNPLDALKLIHQDDKHWIIPELNNYRKGKQESLNLQFRVILEDGTQKWIWYRESTVFDEHDNPSRYAAVITDISASKIAEQELKIAKEEAEKASRSKSAFLANISHEIRTPMNAVLGFSDLLYSRINDPVLKGYLNSIKSSGNTLLNLLNDILDLSKIEAEKMSIIPSPINLFSVFDEIKHIFSLKALEKGLDYSFDIDKNIPESLLLDELRLKQILLNLVDNAVKFTDAGIIKVGAKRIDRKINPDKVDILIIVEDTGIGIPWHMQESIFESFRQQDDQDKRKYQGTGLGLAITKRLIELFNGEIKLKSQPDKGSKFEVILKDIEISKPLTILNKVSGKKIRFENSVLKDKIIVLIDGQKSNRDLIKEVFYHSKSIVIEGENLESIIPELNGKADLILMELNNHELVLRDLEIIKKHKNLKNVPKIGITSLVDFDESFYIEFKTILTKPIHLPDLVEIVGTHFHLNSADGNSEGKVVVEHDLIDKEVLSKVINLLEREHYKIWESSLMTSSFSEIEEFAQKMKSIGLEYNLKVLQTFSDVLVMHAKSFDIDNMNDVLKSYPSIINELKNSL